MMSDIADTKDLELIKESGYFFAPVGEDECMKCDQPAVGVLYLWYEYEDVGYLGYYCQSHLLEDYRMNWSSFDFE